MAVYRWLHGRASACQYEIVGGAYSIPGKFNTFTLGISLSQDETIHENRYFRKMGINLLSAVCRAQVHKNENCILLVVCCHPSKIDRG
jgi:hypothetical protein